MCWSFFDFNRTRLTEFWILTEFGFGDCLFMKFGFGFLNEVAGLNLDLENLNPLISDVQVTYAYASAAHAWLCIRVNR